MLDYLLEMGFRFERMHQRKDRVNVTLSSPGNGEMGQAYMGDRAAGEGANLAEATTVALARLVTIMERTTTLNEQENAQLNRELTEARRSFKDLVQNVLASKAPVAGVVNYVNGEPVGYDPNATLPGAAGIGQDGGPCLEAVTIMDVNGAVVGCVTFPDQDLGQVTIEWQEHNGKAVPA